MAAYGAKWTSGKWVMSASGAVVAQVARPSDARFVSH
jgi:hypothetical protein